MIQSFSLLDKKIIFEIIIPHNTMEQSQTNFEDIVAGVERIASVLGISLNGLATIELFAVQAYISGVLGGNTEIAEKIMKLACSMAEGKNPQKEIDKLKNRVVIHESLNVNPPLTEQKPPQPKASLHFSNRTELARKRLPKTGGRFAKWKPHTIFRGPKKTNNK